MAGADQVVPVRIVIEIMVDGTGNDGTPACANVSVIRQRIVQT